MQEGLDYVERLKAISEKLQDSTNKEIILKWRKKSGLDWEKAEKQIEMIQEDVKKRGYLLRSPMQIGKSGVFVHVRKQNETKPKILKSEVCSIEKKCDIKHAERVQEVFQQVHDVNITKVYETFDFTLDSNRYINTVFENIPLGLDDLLHTFTPFSDQFCYLETQHPMINPVIMQTITGMVNIAHLVDGILHILKRAQEFCDFTHHNLKPGNIRLKLKARNLTDMGCFDIYLTDLQNASFTWKEYRYRGWIGLPSNPYHDARTLAFHIVKHLRFIFERKCVKNDFLDGFRLMEQVKLSLEPFTLEEVLKLCLQEDGESVFMEKSAKERKGNPVNTIMNSS